MTRHDSCQVSPFGHPGITARLTAPPGLSRPPTSFIGSWCQGIHRSPLTTYPQKTRCSRPLCNSQPTTNPQPHSPHQHHHSDRYERPGYVWTEIPTTSSAGQMPPAGLRLFFQDPTGCCLCSPSPAAPAQTRSVETRGFRVLGVPAVAGSNWPVSPPLSTPPPRAGGAGYWTVSSLVAP